MQKCTSISLLGKEFGDSREKVRRYIRLTYLIPELLKIIDDTVLHNKRSYLTMGITIGVESSYLNKTGKTLIYNMIV